MLCKVSTAENIQSTRFLSGQFWNIFGKKEGCGILWHLSLKLQTNFPKNIPKLASLCKRPLYKNSSNFELTNV